MGFIVLDLGVYRSCGNGWGQGLVDVRCGADIFDMDGFDYGDGDEEGYGGDVWTG